MAKTFEQVDKSFLFHVHFRGKPMNVLTLV